MGTFFIKSQTNGVEVSLFDVYTTAYFLTANMMLEEHRQAKSPVQEEGESDEL